MVNLHTERKLGEFEWDECISSPSNSEKLCCVFFENLLKNNENERHNQMYIHTI